MLRELVTGIAFLFALIGLIAAMGITEKSVAKAESQVTEIIREANENQ